MKTKNVNSAPTRDANAIAHFERMDAAIVALADEIGAAAMQYPVLISRENLERAEYPKAFPHLLMVAAPLKQHDLEGASLLEPANLDSPRCCLSPAVCYHVYSHFAGQQFDEPKIVTARGRCFRHEAEIEAGRRQIEFEMREIVVLGPATFVEDIATSMKDRLEHRARQAGLSGDWQIAEDPFFLPRAAGQAMMQRLMETKLEFVADGPSPIALASINRHGVFFGRRFDIRDRDGNFVHTACIAAGLDRWASCSCASNLAKEVQPCRS